MTCSAMDESGCDYEHGTYFFESSKIMEDNKSVKEILVVIWWE